MPAHSTQGVSHGKRSNQSIELARLLAALCIPFIHYLLPGAAGELAKGMARFAVPFFFIISGYFSLGITSRKVVQRLRRSIVLMLCASLLYAIWDCVLAKLAGSDVRQYLSAQLSFGSITRWLLLEQNPFSFHLWYLSTCITIYVILYLYLVLAPFDEGDPSYRPLYMVASAGFTVTVFFDLMCSAYGMAVDYKVYRNALGMGLPFFMLGMALHKAEENKAAAPQSIRCHAGVAFVGVCLSGLQVLGIGVAEIPVGSVLTALALARITLSRPIPSSPALRHLAKLPLADISLALYVIHPMIAQALEIVCARRGGLVSATVTNAWVFPFAVAALSLVASTCYGLLVSHLIHRPAR